MSFTLRVHFAGLCLFTAEEDRLHVILIDHRGHSHGVHGGHSSNHDTEAHLPRLVYDKAYEQEGSTRPSGHLVCEKLDSWILRLDGIAHGIDSRLPEQIVNLHTIAGVGKLSRDYVADAPQPNHVIARVTTDAGKCMPPRRGARWRVNEGPARGWKGEITTCVQWTIEADDKATALSKWQLVGFNGTEKALPTLHPIQRAIELFIYNATERDLPPSERETSLGVGERAEHFDAYYKLFNDENIIPVIDIPYKVVPCLPAPIESSDCKEVKFGILATPASSGCAVAQAPLKARAAGEP